MNAKRPTIRSAILRVQCLEDRCVPAAVTSPLKSIYAVGAGPGSLPGVKVYNGQGTLIASFLAYSPSFRGGVSVAVGDVNGDGTLDIITGAGPGGGPLVQVFDGTKLNQVQADGTLPASALITSFFAYDRTFTGGVNVAAGYVEGGSLADIVTGAGPSGGPHVEVFSYRPGVQPLVLFAGGPVPITNTLWKIDSFFAYDASFRGGVNVAAGDLNGDGYADVITGAGPGGGPHVKAFDGLSLARSNTTDAVANPLQSFFAYAPTFAGGVNVAAGDVEGIGRAAIITGAGPGGGPHVEAFGYVPGVTNDVRIVGEPPPVPTYYWQQVSSFFAYATNFTGGVRVASVAFGNRSAVDIVTAPGPSGGSNIGVFDVLGKAVASFPAFDPTFQGGVFVG